MNKEPRIEPSATPETSRESSVTRRQVLLGLFAAGATGVITMAGMREGNPDSNRSVGDVPPRATPPSSPTEMATNSTPSTNEAGQDMAPAEASYSDELREMAENEPFEKLVEAFRITKDQAPTPSKFIEEYAKRLEMILNAGCTPEEVADFTNEAAEGYFGKMADKYDRAALEGMYGLESTDADIESTAEYQTITSAHQAVLRRYLDAINSDKSGPYVKVEAVGQPETKGMYEGKQLIEFTLRVTEHNEDDQATVPIEAPISLYVTVDRGSGLYDIAMDATATELFEEIAA